MDPIIADLLKNTGLSCEDLLAKLQQYQKLQESDSSNETTLVQRKETGENQISVINEGTDTSSSTNIGVKPKVSIKNEVQKVEEKREGDANHDRNYVQKGEVNQCNNNNLLNKIEPSPIEALQGNSEMTNLVEIEDSVVTIESECGSPSIVLISPECPQRKDDEKSTSTISPDQCSEPIVKRNPLEFVNKMLSLVESKEEVDETIKDESTQAESCSEIVKDILNDILNEVVQRREIELSEEEEKNKHLFDAFDSFAASSEINTSGEEQTQLDESKDEETEKISSDEHNYSVKSDDEIATSELPNTEDNLRDILRLQLNSLRNMKKSSSYLCDIPKKTLLFENIMKRRKSLEASSKGPDRKENETVRPVILNISSGIDVVSELDARLENTKQPSDATRVKKRKSTIVVKQDFSESFDGDPGTQGGKNTEKSPFISNSLEDFLSESQLKVSYPIPKLGAEEGIIENKPSVYDALDSNLYAIKTKEVMVKSDTHRKKLVSKRIKGKARTLADMRRQYESSNSTDIKSKKVPEKMASSKLTVKDFMPRNSYVWYNGVKIVVSSKVSDTCLARIEDKKQREVEVKTRKPSIFSTPTKAVKVRYKIGPLSKKCQLQDEDSKAEWKTEVKDLPKIHLEVRPELGKPLDESILHLIPFMNETVVSKDRALFALTALKSNQKKKLKVYDFEVPYKHNQTKMIVRSLHAEVKPEEPALDDGDVVTSILSNIITYIETKEIEDSLIQEDDYNGETETCRELEEETKKKVAPKRRRIDVELRRLNCKVIDVANQSEKVPCSKAFCKLGCVCESLACQSLFSNHCQEVNCMFGCTCKNTTVTQSLKGDCLSQNTLSHLADQVQRNLGNLAKVEREFTQTLIHTDDDVILVGSGGRERSRRESKLPKRYSDFIDVDEEKPPVGKPIGTVDPASSGYVVNLTKLKLENVIPLCLSHNTYNCYCRGKIIEASDVHKIVNITGEPLKMKITKRTQSDGGKTVAEFMKSSGQKVEERLKPTSRRKQQLNVRDDSIGLGSPPKKRPVYKEFALQRRKKKEKKRPNVVIDGEIKLPLPENCQHIAQCETDNNQNYLRILPWNKLIESFQNKKIHIWARENCKSSELLCNSADCEPPAGYVDIRKARYKTEIITSIITDTLPDDKPREFLHLILTRQLGPHFSISGYCQRNNKNAVNGQNLTVIERVSGDNNGLFVPGVKTAFAEKPLAKVAPFANEVEIEPIIITVDDEPAPSDPKYEPIELDDVVVTKQSPPGAESRILKVTPHLKPIPESVFNNLRKSAEKRLELALKAKAPSSVSAPSCNKIKLNGKKERKEKEVEEPNSVTKIERAVERQRPRVNGGLKTDVQSVSAALAAASAGNTSGLKPVQGSGQQKIIPNKCVKCTHKDMTNKTCTLIISSIEFAKRPVYLKEGIKVSEMKIGLPKIPSNYKWQMMFLQSDFSFLLFTKSKYSIKYTDLMDVVKMAGSIKATVTLRSKDFSNDYLHPYFGIFCTPTYPDRLFIGPFELEEEHNTDTLRYFKRQLVNTNDYNKIMGKTEKSPQWIYEDSSSTVIDISEDEEDVAISERPTERKLAEFSELAPMEHLLCQPFVQELTTNELSTKNINRYIFTSVPTLGYFEAFQHENKEISVFWPDRVKGYKFPNVPFAKHSLILYLMQVFIPIPHDYKINVIIMTNIDLRSNKPMDLRYFSTPREYVCGDFGVCKKNKIPDAIVTHFQASSAEELLQENENPSEILKKMIRLFGLFLMSNEELQKNSEPNDILSWACSEIFILERLMKNYESEKQDLVRIINKRTDLKDTMAKTTSEASETIEILDSDEEGSEVVLKPNRSCEMVISGVSEGGDGLEVSAETTISILENY